MPRHLLHFVLISLASSCRPNLDGPDGVALGIQCKPKPGCRITQCDPIPPGWKDPRFPVEDYLKRMKFPITCEAEELEATLINSMNSSTELGKEVRKLRQESAERAKEVTELKSEVSELKRENRKISVMERRLADMEELIEKLKLGKPEGASGVSTPPRKPAACELRIGGICYWSAISTNKGLTYQQAYEICRGGNSVIAVIPNRGAHEQVLKHLRSKIPQGKTLLGVWTGMKFDTKNNKVATANVFTKWHPARPWTGRAFANYIHIYVNVRSDPQNEFQGLSNGPANWKQFGVLCQRVF